MNKRKNEGFTLIEILIVIGIIAILAAVVLVAVNPARQFAQANDSQRSSNVNAILNAIGQYMADNRGQIPSVITGTAQDISNTGANLCNVLVPVYLPALPTDPKSVHKGESITDCGTYNTKYQVSTTTSNRIIVSAPLTEVASTMISVSR